MKNINLELFDRTKNYITPDGNIHTPESLRNDYTIIQIPDAKLVIETDVTGMYMFTVPEPLYSKAQRMNLDYTQFETDEALLTAMEDILNAPEPEPEPSAEERIAAAMEYQNLFI